MESLAALVSAIFLGLIVFSLLTVAMAVLTRIGKVRLWVSMVFNVITGLLAAWGISVTWALGIIPFLGLVISSIVLTWPKKKRQ